MTRALLAKELRAALPVALLWILAWCGGLLEPFLVGSPDLAAFEDVFSGLTDQGAQATFTIVVALWLGGILLNAERDSGTGELLDALPTTRDRVFLVKAAAGFLVLLAAPVLHLAGAAALGAVGRTSVEPAPSADFVLRWIGLQAVLAGVALSVSLLLAFLRTFRWLAAAVLVTTVAVVSRSVPSVDVFDPTRITEATLVGATLVVPWRAIAVQVPLAGVCLAAAWLLHRGAGDALARWGERIGGTWAGRAAAVAVVAVSAVAWIALPAYLIAREHEDAPEDEHGVVYAGWGRGHARTARYAVTYPSDLAARAGEFLAAADGVHERVRSWFEAPAIPVIDVDATGAGPTMYAGRAYHRAMQIDLPGAPTVHDLLATLYHETGHLYVDEVTKDRLARDFRWARFLHEGLCNHLEYHMVRGPEDRARLRRGTAFDQAFAPVTFEMLIDDERLCRERDPYVVYRAGAAWAAALESVHGPKAALRLLRAIARDDAPQDLSGIDLWRDAFQAAGLDLEGVVDRWDADLAALVAEHRAAIDAVPAPRGRVHEQTGEGAVEWVGVTPAHEGALPGDWSFVVRFRRADTDTYEDFLPARENGGTHWVERSSFPGRSAGWQIGLASAREGFTSWGPWQEATLKR